MLRPVGWESGFHMSPDPCIYAYLNRRVRNAVANVKYISNGIAISVTYARLLDGTASPAVLPYRRRRAPVHAGVGAAAYSAAAVVAADSGARARTGFCPVYALAARSGTDIGGRGFGGRCPRRARRARSRCGQRAAGGERSTWLRADRADEFGGIPPACHRRDPPFSRDASGYCHRPERDQCC